MPVLTKLPDTPKALFPENVRVAASAVLIVLAAGMFFALPAIQTASVKSAVFYALTACVMFLIVVRKNYLNFHETALFCFLCAQFSLLAPKPGEEDWMNMVANLLSYRYGASSRSLAATIIDFFCNGSFISKYFVWHFMFCFYVFLSFLVSLYLGLIIQKSAETVKPFVALLSLFFVTSFTAPAAYFGDGNFGRPEIFAFIFMLVMLAVLKRPVLRWIIPLLALLTLGTHVILLFFYIPFIAVMLLYELFTEQNKSKSTLLLFGVTAAVVAAGFLLYVFFHEKTFVFSDAHSLAEYLRTKTDITVDEGGLYAYMFAQLRDHLDWWKDRVTLTFPGHVSVILVLPFVAAFAVFWIKCIRLETKRLMKFFFSLPVVILPWHAIAFFMFFDFGRWMIMIMNIQFMFLFYLLYVRNETVIAAAEKTAVFVKKYWFACVLVCVFTAFLGPVSYINPPDRVIRTAKVFGKLLKGLGLAP